MTSINAERSMCSHSGTYKFLKANMQNKNQKPMNTARANELKLEPYITRNINCTNKLNEIVLCIVANSLCNYNKPPT